MLKPYPWAEPVPAIRPPMKTKAYPWHELEVVGGPAGRKSNKKTEFPAYLSPTDESANAPMPRCRTPMPSKGKQRIGAVSYRKRFIETQTAVMKFRNHARSKFGRGLPVSTARGRRSGTMPVSNARQAQIIASVARKARIRT